MLRLIILLAIGSSFNDVLSDPSPNTSTNAEQAVTSSLTSSSGASSSSGSTSSSSTYNNKPKKCGINEVYNPCPEPNTADGTCENLIKPNKCPLPPSDYPCKGDCRCKPGYYRNKIGQCISEEDCKKCPGKYEYFACDNACDNECDKLSRQSHTNCPIINIKCNPMCYCLEGYARDENKKCIPISQCPPECKKNEEYSKCPNSVCREKTCNDLGYPLPCLQSGTKKPKCDQPCCICKRGYVRNKHGLCIPSRECPSCGGDPNAWSGCGTFCTRCSNYKDKDRVCLLICKINGCDCRPGYVYDGTSKKCVLPEKCPPLCGPNEVASNCANDPRIKNCATKDSDLPCKLPHPVCKPGCVCAKGYLRNRKGVCVPINKCEPQCKKNEEYSECPNKVCRPKKCDDLGFPLPCNQLSTKSTDCGKPGCICKAGSVRNKHGECVDPKTCPSCGGDPNAWPGCGTFCIRCDNYKNKSRACTASCMLNGCDCRPNYVYNQVSKKCVLPKHCPNC